MWMTLWDLLRIFGSIGLFSIGGGYAIIPLLQEQVVDNQQWLTQQAFTDIITISQMTPGPVAVEYVDVCRDADGWPAGIDCRHSGLRRSGIYFFPGVVLVLPQVPAFQLCI